MCVCIGLTRKIVIRFMLTNSGPSLFTVEIFIRSVADELFLLNGFLENEVIKQCCGILGTGRYFHVIYPGIAGWHHKINGFGSFHHRMGCIYRCYASANRAAMGIGI